jgi:hypothetical protein
LNRKRGASIPAGRERDSSAMALFHLAGEGHAVGAGLLLHRQDHRRLAPVAGVAALDGRRQLHLRHLLQRDGLAIPHRHHQVLQILDAGAAADLADQVFAAPGLEEAAAGVGAEIGQGRFQLVPLHAQGPQLFRPQLHPVLAHLAADGRDLGDAGDRQQARAHHPVGVFPHPHRAGRVRVDGGAGQGDEQDLAHDGRDGPQLRHDARRQLFPHQVQALGDLLAVEVDVAAPLEFHIDDGQPHAGHRAHPGHAGHAVHGGFDGEGDQLLHLLRRHAPGLGHQGHGGLVEVGEDVHRHLPA